MFDEQKAGKVFQVLSNYYKNKEGLYGIVVLPQDARPLLSNEPKDIANWFFFIAHFMRGGVINDTQFDFFWCLFEEFPQFFNPAEIYDKWPPSQIYERALKFVASKININGKGLAGVLGFKAEEHLRHLHHNAGIVKYCWGNNALNIFEGVKDFEQAFARIDYQKCRAGFLGIRRKIFALLTIWLQEAGVISFFPAPIPVDFHAMRIFLQTGIISNDQWVVGKSERHPFLTGKYGRRITEPFVDEIALWTQRFMFQQGFSHLVINPACWILSRELCAGHFQTRPVSKDYDEYVNPAELKKNPNLWPKRYKNPCAFCPIEQFCEGIVPSKPYYKWGLLVKLTRVSYFNKKPFLPGMQDLFFPPLAKSRKKIISR